MKALLRGLFEGPEADPELRRELEEEADRLGAAALHARLAALDPATARRLHPNDRRRVVRALEVIAATGRPLSTLQTEHDRPAPEGVKVVALERPRGALHDRIDRRVVQMFADGFEDEVRALQGGARPLGPVAVQGVGYREVLDRLAGRLTFDETVARVQARTRQFAKRQATWFRGLDEVRPWPLSGDEPPDVTAERLADCARLKLTFLDPPRSVIKPRHPGRLTAFARAGGYGGRPVPRHLMTLRGKVVRLRWGAGFRNLRFEISNLRFSFLRSQIKFEMTRERTTFPPQRLRAGFWRRVRDGRRLGPFPRRGPNSWAGDL